tara:strand:+ start:145998 stop:146387 length:390 start_codon:yes stop_codon:yes gene_type:complete
MDTIGDFLTIIRNALSAKKGTCDAQWSKIREGIAQTLKSEGYIADFAKKKNEKGHEVLEVTLKYVEGTPAIEGIERHSRPGRRLYYGSRSIPRVLNNLGVAVLTTSKGVLTDKEARRQRVGGEMLCKVW